jgi:hypothetical protein
MTDKTSFEYVSEKLGRVTPATSLIAEEVFDAAKAGGHAPWYMWGYDGNASNTEHHSGRALDFMVKSKAHGDWIRNYLWTNRGRLRLRHVIWQQHITSTVTQPGVVRKMEDRGDPTQNHMDHVHVLFNDGLYQPKNNVSVPPKKSIKIVAEEVRAGAWGNGDDRRHRLQKAGYDYAQVQAEVNRQLGSPAAPKRKTVSQVAQEIFAGKGGWGDGEVRVRKLKAAGYDPKAVQREVNRLF